MGQMDRDPAGALEQATEIVGADVLGEIETMSDIRLRPPLTLALAPL